MEPPPTIKENVLLAPFTIFNVGGVARFFCEAHTKQELINIIKWAKDKNLHYFVLGAGSNILISDEGFSGVIVKVCIQGIQKKENELFVESGVAMAKIVHIALKQGLGGCEWAIGIPGTLGGSIYGNAGCYGGEIKDIVQNVEIFNTSTFSQEIIGNASCNFSYRTSIFKNHPDWIILGATIQLQPCHLQRSMKLIRSYAKKRIENQDIGSKCAGCIFKNPSTDTSAGSLIDAAGLKGHTIGGAMISTKHANFIINTGNATARDILQLISFIKEKVKKNYGIDLEEEVKILIHS